MTEYRVVCTTDEHHNYNGKDFHYEIATPVIYPSDDSHSSYHLKRVYRDKSEAEKALAEAIKGCPIFDAKHDNEKRDNIRVRQYNIRIQTREVSEWK